MGPLLLGYRPRKEQRLQIGEVNRSTATEVEGLCSPHAP